MHKIIFGIADCYNAVCVQLHLEESRGKCPHHDLSIQPYLLLMSDLHVILSVAVFLTWYVFLHAFSVLITISAALSIPVSDLSAVTKHYC